MSTRWPSLYLLSCCIVLVFAGLSKLYTLSSGIELLTHLDPVFGVRMDLLLSFVAVLEIVIGVMACSNTNQQMMSIGTVLLSFAFLWYRAMLAWLGFTGYCNCLGTLHLLAGVPESFMQMLTLLLCVYFAIGGITSVLSLRSHQPSV